MEVERCSTYRRDFFVRQTPLLSILYVTVLCCCAGAAAELGGGVGRGAERVACPRCLETAACALLTTPFDSVHTCTPDVPCSVSNVHLFIVHSRTETSVQSDFRGYIFRGRNINSQCAVCALRVMLYNDFYI